MKSNVLSGGRVYYSSKDLARMFSVNESTIKRWADSGKLPCFRTVGRHRRFPFEVVSEFVEKYHMELSIPPDLVKEAIRK
jgi:excisionase family DNA binding protein